SPARSCPMFRSAGRARPGRLAAGNWPASLDRLQVANGAGQRTDPYYPQPARHCACRVRAIIGRAEEDRRARGPGPGHLLLDAANRSDRAARLDLSSAGDESTAGQVAGCQLVDDAEREHQPGARAPDVGEIDLDAERKLVGGRPELDSHDG